MKKILLLLAILLLLSVFPGLFSSNNRPAAQGGCCMQRRTLSSPNWYNNGLDYRRCRDLNRKRDGDDLYQKTGLIYWEFNC